MEFDNTILDGVNLRLIERVFIVSILICVFMYVTSSNSTNNAHDNLSISLNTVLAQTTNNSKTQLWVDKEDNVKIIFGYNPEHPIIGNPTELLFSIQNLHTGHEIKERLDVQVVVTNQREILKIINSTFTEGNFSVSYAFPDSGSYKVISKIKSKKVEEAPFFNVFVPPNLRQVLPNFLMSCFFTMLFPLFLLLLELPCILSIRKRYNIRSGICTKTVIY